MDKEYVLQTMQTGDGLVKTVYSRIFGSLEEAQKALRDAEHVDQVFVQRQTNTFTIYEREVSKWTEVKL